MSKIVELYGTSTQQKTEPDWKTIVHNQQCPFLQQKCTKSRKSEPHITIGTCSVLDGREQKRVMICPCRLREGTRVFDDCRHLLNLHEPNNELRVIPEVSIPGGRVDYFLVSVREGVIKDFVGIELQTVDTTGTVWPERQKLLMLKGLEVSVDNPVSNKRYNMNWRMSAKTILSQLHHKISTLENIKKHLVLVIQDHFFNDMKKKFRFDHLNRARNDDSMHIHTYKLSQTAEGRFKLELDARFSTDANGIALSLGPQSRPNTELKEITTLLESKLTGETSFTL